MSGLNNNQRIYIEREIRRALSSPKNDIPRDKIKVRLIQHFANMVYEEFHNSKLKDIDKLTIQLMELNNIMNNIQV